MNQFTVLFSIILTRFFSWWSATRQRNAYIKSLITRRQLKITATHYLIQFWWQTRVQNYLMSAMPYAASFINLEWKDLSIAIFKCFLSCLYRSLCVTTLWWKWQGQQNNRQIYRRVSFPKTKATKKTTCTIFTSSSLWTGKEI